MLSMHNATNETTTNKTAISVPIWIFMSSLKQLTVASFLPVNAGDGRHWTITDPTGKCSAAMNGATLRHEWAIVSLWWAVKQAWKYKWTLPWGSGRRQAMETGTHSQGMSLCCKCPAGVVCLLVLFEGQVWGRENSVFITCRSLDELSLAFPSSIFSAKRPFNDCALTNYLYYGSSMKICFITTYFNTMWNTEAS